MVGAQLLHIKAEKSHLVPKLLITLLALYLSYVLNKTLPTEFIVLYGHEFITEKSLPQPLFN